jgi:GPH family glycoside/pentoside/hexuronide:cation symporter
MSGTLTFREKLAYGLGDTASNFFFQAFNIFLADYGEWKLGRRSTGLVFSATVFVQKVGLAIGSAMIGWLLAYYGYVAEAEQSARTLHGITLLYSAFPGAFALLSGLAIYFYSLEETDVKTIEAELARRKRR